MPVPAPAHHVHDRSTTRASARLPFALLLAASLALFATAAFAQQAPAANGVEDRAQSFEAVTGAQKEDVPGGPLLVAAYAVVWVAVFGYVLRLGRLHVQVEQNLGRIEAAVAGAQKRASESE
ncbi:MAG TPA: CcmD family protein [Polyangiales bacterium]